MESNIISSEDDFNNKLQTKILTLNDLGIYLRFRFGNNAFAGLKARISSTRVRQILIGYNLPKSVKLIKQISQGWEIDEIVLTQLFERFRSKKDEVKDGQKDRC